jgi:hypothetical protein
VVGGEQPHHPTADDEQIQHVARPGIEGVCAVRHELLFLSLTSWSFAG